MTAERNDTESEDYEREDLNREVLSVQIKDRLLQWIMEGELPPGSRIVETRIARRLGVSQAPVREALRDLASVGIVQVEPYRGAFVRRPSPDELAEAMTLRGELEALGARWAVERITDEDLVELRRLIDAMDRAAAAHDTHAHALHNTTFHQRIMEASGNRSLLWVWSLLEPMARTYYTAAVSGADLGWLGRRHLAIVEALESRDPEKVAEVMRAHAKEAEESILSHFANERDEEGAVS